MGINSTTLSGNVGQDPEVRWLESGSVVAKFSLAVQGYKNKEKTTMWFPCVAWGKTAETIGEYIKKGYQVTVSGSLDIEEWITPANEKRSKTVVIVRDIQLPPRPAGGALPSSEDYAQY